MNITSEYLKRLKTITSAMLLMSDLTLEWDSSFTLEFRLWILGYLARNANNTADGHYEAYELAKILVADE